VSFDAREPNVPETIAKKLAGQTAYGLELRDAIRAEQLWPTPATMNPNEQEDLDSWQKRREQCRERHGNNGFGVPLGIAVRLWPTPTAAMTTGPGGNREGTPNLQTAVSAWPTPKARDYRSVSGNEDRHSPDLNVAALWHTPQASDGEGSRTGVSGTSGTGRTPDGRKVSTSLQSDLRSEIGRLNPAWVCSLMGFPCGWLDIGPPDQASPKQPGKRPGP
jgi:hypothetical protein